MKGGPGSVLTSSLVLAQGDGKEGKDSFPSKALWSESCAGGAGTEGQWKSFCSRGICKESPQSTPA